MHNVPVFQPAAEREQASLTAVYIVQIQKRINAVIESRRKAGEDLPPAPKTAIAGPEFFGFNQPEVGLLSCRFADGACDSSSYTYIYVCRDLNV